MKPKLYFKKLRFYIAVKADCDAHHNLGLIGMGAGQGQPGVLDVKQELCDRIQRQGGNLVHAPGFVHSSNGRTSFGNGSGYRGWRNFGSQKAVLSFLEKYFTLVECDEVYKPDREVKSSAKRETKLPHAASKLENVSSIRDQTQILAEIGFEDAAQWKIDGVSRISDCGDDSEVWQELKEPKNALYAFCVGSEVLYIGKTSRSLEKRFVGYRDPGKTRATNWKCYKEIKKLLNANKTVRIMVLVDRTHFHWGQFRVSLAAGLEDSLVEIIRPSLNGKNGKISKTESEQFEEDGLTRNNL